MVIVVQVVKEITMEQLAISGNHSIHRANNTRLCTQIQQK